MVNNADTAVIALPSGLNNCRYVLLRYLVRVVVASSQAATAQVRHHVGLPA